MIDANIGYAQITEAYVAALAEGVSDPTVSDHTALGDRVVPNDLRGWLARLRLLEGLPFTYIVPDSALLPPESIRFFHLDRAWTDALVQGALSVGTVSSADRAELDALYDLVRGEIDEEERVVRLPGGDEPGPGPAGPITGFLLRSRAVSAYPGLHVRAYRRDVVGDDEVVPESHPDRLRMLRLERLAPAVLLALFDGIPEIVHVEEPRVGIQFGVRLERGTRPNTFTAFVPARDANTGVDVEPEERIPVSFRRGSPGVLDLRRTGKAFTDSSRTNLGDTLDGAELALQMIRYPFRQIFGDEQHVADLDVVFRPTVGYALTDLSHRFGVDDG